MQNKQPGFSRLLLVVMVIVVVVAVIGVIYQARPKANKDTQLSQNNRSQQVANNNCKPASTGLFTSDVTDTSNIILIQNPIRIVSGDNIKTHSFIEVSKRSPVYAPMSAVLTGGANYYETMGEKPVTKVQYILSFNNSCDVNFWLDHIVDVPSKIKEAFPAKAQDGTQDVVIESLSVKAGELIGYTNQEGRARFDFGVINLAGPETSLTTNPRFKNDPIVKTSDKYRYATCPYDLYSKDQQKTYQSFYDSETDSDQDIIDDICK